MIAYAVRTEFTLGGGAFRCEVDGRDVRGIGYGADEREAVRRAWADYWAKLKAWEG